MSRLVVGVPSEIKDDERRVALTPDGVVDLVHGGHHVVVQAGAGAGAPGSPTTGTPAPRLGLSTLQGDLVDQPVAEAHQLPFTDPATLLASR
ncbi:Cytosine deaminase [Modestobacter italicus]|uniref:Cytosine deaminase n=1 Tax=Modestobacter italicus (strain DSM 44449 / CECT 9708 / BC 501) TaxID=2732864 RepID=I4EY31_MODI5|nr:cytosine deaminase [Modestobacter marinus]CCH88294.1 Cytosine deaminase [Modestobacter marinus]